MHKDVVNNLISLAYASKVSDLCPDLVPFLKKKVSAIMSHPAISKLIAAI